MSIENLLWVLLVVIVFVNAKTALYFVVFLLSTFRIPKYHQVERSDKYNVEGIDQFLLENGFTFQMEFSGTHPQVGMEANITELYYYNEQNGVHASIGVVPTDTEVQTSLTFTTLYASGRECYTLNNQAYIFLEAPESIYLFDHDSVSDLDHYQAHLRDRVMDEEEIIYGVLGVQEALSKIELVNREYTDILYKHKLINYISDDEYRFVFTYKLWGFARRMIKGMNAHKKYVKNRVLGGVKEQGRGFTKLLLKQIDSLDTMHSSHNKKVWFAISLVIFGVIFLALGVDWIDILLIVLILLVHELGHFLAMRYFGYQDTSIFFLPFGAAAVGKKSRKSALEEYTVLMAGPLPGMLIGIAIMVASMYGYFEENSYLQSYAMMSIVINYINLFPIYPLDGGRIVQTLLLLRYPKVQFYFYLLSLTVLSVAMISMQDYLLLIFVVILAIAFKQNYAISIVIQKLLKDKSRNEEVSKLEVAELIEGDATYNSMSLVQKATIAKQVIDILQTSRPSKKLSIFGLGFYLLLLFPTIVIIVSSLAMNHLFGGIDEKDAQKLDAIERSITMMSERSEASEKYDSIALSLETIQDYIGKEKFHPSYQNDNSKSLACDLPTAIESILHVSNGIDALHPFYSLYSQKQMQASYQELQDAMNEENRSAVIEYLALTDQDYYDGLSFSCKDEGLFNYNSYDNTATKIYYSVEHWLQAIATAYKQEAFYYDYDGWYVNWQKMQAIEKQLLSSADTQTYLSQLDKINRMASEMLEDSTMMGKQMLFRSLASTYEAFLASIIRAYMNAEDVEVRSAAIYALGDVGSHDDIALLVQKLKVADDKELLAILYALEKLADEGDSFISESIAPYLDDKEILIRLSAYEVLDKVNPEDAFSFIASRFWQEKSAIQFAMIRIMGKSGDKEALKLLKQYQSTLKETSDDKVYYGGFRGDDVSPDQLLKRTKYAIDMLEKTKP